MTHIDEIYADLVRTVMWAGTRKENRTGIDTLSMFNYNYEVDLDDGFPLLTTKYINWKNIVVELLWFLSGEPKIDFLHKHKCKFWDAWADEENAVPSAYGYYWRNFPHKLATFDQIKHVVETLKTNPNSRRLVVSAWEPFNAHTSKLPPCHCMFILNVQYKQGEPRLCLHLTQRSCDIALGVPYNIASYALLLHMIGRMSGIKPWKFAHTLVDAHIYVAKPDGDKKEYCHKDGLFEQIERKPFKLPELNISRSLTSLDDISEIIADRHGEYTTEKILELFELNNYQHHPKINFKVAV